MKRTVLLGAVLWLTLGAPAGAAVCPSLGPLRERIADARTVFVGTVQSVTDGNRDAAVRVEKIWIGDVLPEMVEVRSSPEEPNLITSTDRAWERGTRYLFVLADASPPFTDDSCSATTPYTDDVAALEPAGVVAPNDGRSLTPWILLAVILVVAGVLQTRRATRRAASLSSTD